MPKYRSATVNGITVFADLPEGVIMEDGRLNPEALRGGYSKEQLEEAFRKIADSTNWKNPIDAVIDEADLKVCEYACQFYTGGQLTITGVMMGSEGDKLRVKAPGYYVSIGA